MDTEITAAERLATLVRWAGLSTLAVCGLGILAIAWISVKERILEIGARRALGATETDIFFQFLFEATAVSAIGAAAGWLLGWESTLIVAQRANLPFLFDWTSAGEVTAVSIFLNVTLALLPSREAARLDPISALKSG